MEADCPVTVDLNGVGGIGQYMWAVGDEGTILVFDRLGGNIQPTSIGYVKALFAPSVEAFGSTGFVKDK